MMLRIEHLKELKKYSINWHHMWVDSIMSITTAYIKRTKITKMQVRLDQLTLIIETMNPKTTITEIQNFID